MKKKIRKTKNDKNKLKIATFSNFKIEEKFEKITIYQKLLITSVETKFMFINEINVKNKKKPFFYLKQHSS